MSCSIVHAKVSDERWWAGVQFNNGAHFREAVFSACFITCRTIMREWQGWLSSFLGLVHFEECLHMSSHVSHLKTHQKTYSECYPPCLYMVRPVLYTLDKLSDNAQGAYNLPRIPPFYTTQLSILQCMLQQCNHTQTSFEGFCSSVRVIGVIRQVFQALHGACCWRILASLAGIVCHSISWAWAWLAFECF